MSQYSVLVAFFFYLCTLTWIITLRELKAILSSRALRFTRYVTQFLHNFITISTSNMIHGVSQCFHKCSFFFPAAVCQLDYVFCLKTNNYLETKGGVL